MMKYERLTDKDWHITKFSYTSTENTRKILKRLWDLENKIEQGTLKEIPENTVVLTREEKEKLYVPDEVWQMVNNARKETAEKFADKLRCEYIDFDNYDEISVDGLREDITKICKEITAEN